MTLLTIINGNEKIETDLTPVEEIIAKYKNILDKRKNFQDRTHVSYHIEVLEKLKNLNETQKDYLINGLLGLIGYYADLNQKFLDNPLEEAKKVQGYKDLFNQIQKALSSN